MAALLNTKKQTLELMFNDTTDHYMNTTYFDILVPASEQTHLTVPVAKYVGQHTQDLTRALLV